MKIEDASGTRQIEVNLSDNEVTAVDFGHDYLYYEVRNDGNEDIYVSTTDNECTAGGKGVVCAPAGTGYTHYNGCGGSEKLYLLGKGKVTVVAKDSGESSFKSVKRGGGYAVAGSSSYALNNAVDYPVLGLNLYGKSTQDGTPTPDNPVDIVSVGDSGSATITADNGNSVSVTANITTALPLCGIPVSKGGNYTDSNGQQWICDELIYNADGTGKIIKNIRKYTFTGTEEGGIWQLNGSIDSTKNRFQFKITDENIKAVYDTSKFTAASKSRILCDKYQAVTPEDTWKLKNGIAASHTAGYIAIYDENYATISTINDWIAYLAENPVTVIYQLNKPQEIELTAAEMAQLRQLQTYSGITNISNDSGADMDVKICTNKTLAEYVVPITTGLQKQIDELKSAVLSLGGNI